MINTMKSFYIQNYIVLYLKTYYMAIKTQSYKYKLIGFILYS